jgi:murein DD-endopeptidase MepM/ murein hydrolase activator NlpD
LWPVRGHVLAGYGSGPDGTHNDGINIAAPRGAAVEAADAGVVAYAGNELRGYGNLILVKHANGWISAYAHCDLMLVKRGERVARGQIIARVGATGNVGEPQLHFELRRGNHAVDPREFLAPPATARGTGSGPELAVLSPGAIAL